MPICVMTLKKKKKAQEKKQENTENVKVPEMQSV